MIYKICRLFFFLFYFFFQSNVNAQNIAYIDIDYIINNSLAGKDILIQLKQKFKAKDENFKDKENKFKKKEKQLLAQKNILDSNEYKKKLLILKNEVEGYKKEKNVFLKEFNRIKLEYTKLM